MSHRYTVIGNPIEHSRSPRIHELFAEQTHRHISYTKTLAEIDTNAAETFEDTVTLFFQNGGSGCNVTVPFKQRAAALCDELSEAATQANAVNTISQLPDDRLMGHNTDGSGLVCDLTNNLGLELSGRRILIAGAGGATSGIIGPLLAENTASILIANRSVDKAHKLAEQFSEHGTVESCTYDAIPQQSVDLVLNATSLGLQHQKPLLPDGCIRAQHTIAYDLMYGSETPFMIWAKAQGATVHDGLGMLLEQAADAFEIWEGVRPKTRLMRARM